MAGEAIARYLVVADVCTQLQEALLLFCQVDVGVVVLYFDMKLLACLHSELIYDDLSEETMVDVGLPGRLQPAVSYALTEVAVGDAPARVQYQTDRDDEDGYEEV